MHKFLLLFIVLITSQLSAQNNFYIELGGVGGFGSLNYETSILKSNSTRFRAGLSFAKIDDNNGSVIILPFLLHHSFGEKHKLDFGVGQTLSVTTKGNFFVRMPLSIGYQIEPTDKRHFFRFAYTPIVSYLVNFQWEHWGGVAFGYKLFKK